jgi:hypothetical protein
MFATKEIYDKVKNSRRLTRDAVAALYFVPEGQVTASLFFDPAMAYKATKYYCETSCVRRIWRDIYSWLAAAHSFDVSNHALGQRLM